MKKTLKAMREDKLYTSAFIPHGNGKLIDYDNPETGERFRYAQINTRALLDCPFASEGCKAICYATKGNHIFKSVKESRQRSYEETKRSDYVEAMTYTIKTEKTSSRFRNATMLIRVHESGDFYSIQYLRKNLKIWASFTLSDNVQFKFYTKSFPFFLMLTEEEKNLLRYLMYAGIVVMNLSLDDTTSREQWKAYHRMRKEFPNANTYYATEKANDVEHDNVCDCANCAKCGVCNNGTGSITVVVIHSASNADMDKYRKAKKERT